MEQSFVMLPTLEYGYEIHTEGHDSLDHPLHVHKDAVELLLIMDGEGLFTVNGITYQVGSGSLLCYNSGIWHAEHSISPYFSSLYLTFTSLKVKHLPNNHFVELGRPPFIQLGDHFASIKLLMMDIIQEKSCNDPHSKFAADQLLSVLLSKLMRIMNGRPLSKSNKSSSHESAVKAKRYIENKYNTDITLKELSQFTHISPFYLSHLFKTEFGISPIQYLIQYRMEVAKHYLLHFPYTIKEIAELVGYDSDTYFHQIFKKCEKGSPGEFRELHKQRE
ncbi:AraC family transcriptional regulator [Paenibacillus eucommiae]|uniref:AraC-like DNA-binding protein n=1 Tax=Paenibacillus eucommiae TaxID=1355755 RepID=A0ABS4J1C7_9BACL|nr:AraC family transcriptional regulator [Paenibacillus eucommiae]MBP1993621.1 AraC-like DNA-binding protein [Paenibacillus eucommiae]